MNNKTQSWLGTLGSESLDTQETTAESLLEPLYESENPALLANRQIFTVRGAKLEIPKLLLLGNRKGGVPLRVGLFAGLDAGRLETVAAVSRLLLQFSLTPALAEDYALFSYPIVNPAGFSPARTSAEELQERWGKNPGDADAHWFRSEFHRIAHHGIITFRSNGQNQGFAASVRSKIIAEEVVAPAIDAMKSLVPIDKDPIRILPTNLNSRRGEFSRGRLIPVPETKPWPFEIELFAPEIASADGRSQVLMLATLQILRGYRRFIAQGGDL
ncbi:MAG: hypothetical protein WCO60_13295 [Verrucomicrobiota bacterium]